MQEYVNTENLILSREDIITLKKARGLLNKRNPFLTHTQKTVKDFIRALELIYKVFVKYKYQDEIQFKINNEYGILLINSSNWELYLSPRKIHNNLLDVIIQYKIYDDIKLIKILTPLSDDEFIFFFLENDAPIEQLLVISIALIKHVSFLLDLND